MEIIKKPFVNHGVLAYTYEIIAGGRVGNPAYIVRSDDGGETWQSYDMNDHCKFILDIQFLDEDTGFVCAGSSTDLSESHALILKTTDSGETWKKRIRKHAPL